MRKEADLKKAKEREKGKKGRWDSKLNSFTKKTGGRHGCLSSSGAERVTGGEGKRRGGERKLSAVGAIRIRRIG